MTHLRPHARRLIAAATVALVALVPGLAACGDDESPSVAEAGGTAQPPGDGEATDPTVLKVTTGSSAGGDPEYRFDVPDEVSAGPTRLSLSNQGAEPHHAQVFRLEDDATLADLESALATGESAAALEVGSFLGGTGLVSPGEMSRADAVLDLEPGEYALLCFVPGADGLPHVAHGMVQPFEVTTAEGPPPSPPDADVEVELVDYAFAMPDTVDGDATLAITNASASEAHEMVIAAVDDGVTAQDVADALNRGEPLPGVGVGGMQAILPGATQHLQLDLEPGRYVVLCAVTSPDGTAHYHAGMIDEVTVT